MANYPEKVYVNGKIVAGRDAQISVFDRGFLFGDGIYEVMIQIGEGFLYGKEHLDRLATCLKKVNLDFDVASLPKEIKRLLTTSKLNGENCLVYIQITRGAAIRKHAFPEVISPGVVMYAIPFTLPDINQKSMAAVTTYDLRWHRCDIKTTSLLGNVMANSHAADQGVFESIFIRDGKITEASHCNVFFVKNEVVYTHPADINILDGITRQIILQLCRNLKIAFKEEAVLIENLSLMDEAFLSGTTTQIASIGRIDNHFYSQDGSSGRITRKLQEAFLELKERHKTTSLGI